MFPSSIAHGQRVSFVEKAYVDIRCRQYYHHIGGGVEYVQDIVGARNFKKYLVEEGWEKSRVM